MTQAPSASGSTRADSMAMYCMSRQVREGLEAREKQGHTATNNIGISNYLSSNITPMLAVWKDALNVVPSSVIQYTQVPGG